MDFQSVRQKAKNFGLFRYVDILKWFSKDNEQTIKQNLKNWVKKRLLERVYRGIYKLPEIEIGEEFIFSSFFDDSSYVSLETALSFYGMVLEYPYAVTAVSTKKTKKIKTKYGVFSYRKIKPSLFFGFKQITDEHSVYRLALPEKALFDYIYLNRREIKSSDYFSDMRLSFPPNFSWKQLNSFLPFPKSTNIISYLRFYANH